MYLVSTIIPFYNGGNHLENVIETLKKQTIGFENIEIIMVNDCSDDESPEIAKRLSLKYDNCYFYDLSLKYCEKSGYPGRPRNLGLKNVHSDYVIFLDIDDYYIDDAFEILYKKIVETKADFVLANHYINSDNGSIKNNLCSRGSLDEIILNPTESQTKFNRVTTGCFIAAWGKIFDYKFICDNDLVFFEEGPTEDGDFYFQVLAVCEKMCILPNTYLYMYNEYGNSTIHNSTEKLFLAFFNGLKRINDFLCENIALNHSVFISDYFSSLLLIFVTLNVDKTRKIEFLEMIYKFEQTTDEIKIKTPEVAFLNNLILKRKFGLAIAVGKLYDNFYNNLFIKKMYRKYMNMKRVK
ncbi:glycosyltransferase family 2 protein [Methanobrevibacter sp.]